MNDFTGKFLVIAESNSLLPVGEIVYCIVDEGFQFRVRTDKTYSGVTEFIFSSESKPKFQLLL